jgi:hypothetical protein
MEHGPSESLTDSPVVSFLHNEHEPPACKGRSYPKREPTTEDAEDRRKNPVDDTDVQILAELPVPAETRLCSFERYKT